MSDLGFKSASVSQRSHLVELTAGNSSGCSGHYIVIDNAGGGIAAGERD